MGEREEDTVEALMARLSVRSERLVRRIEEDARSDKYLEGTVFPWDEDEGCEGGDLAAEHWHRCLEVVRGELREMQREDPRLCAWFRSEDGKPEDDRAHLERVMRKLSSMWRLRDHLLGCMVNNKVGAGIGGEDVAMIRDMAVYMMAVISAEELELEGLRMTRAVRERYGDEGLPALEGWLGGERSVAWWLRESAGLA